MLEMHSAGSAIVLEDRGWNMHLHVTAAPGSVLVLGTPVDFIPQGKPAAILSRLGLDGPGVAASISQALGARATL